MHRQIGLFLATSVLLAACKTPALAPAARPGARPSAAAAAVTTTDGTASAAAAATPAPADKLRPPAGGSAVLSGSVRIDASYLVSDKAGGIIAQGGGNLVVARGGGIVAQGGGNIIAQGAGNVVSNDGGSIIAQGGGNAISVGGHIVAQGAGNIIAQGGGNIVASGGGNIVAAGAGNFVGHNGGAIVAQGGGNIVAQGGGNYHLNATDAVPPYGTVLPAAGMLVWVRDMRTGEPVSVGVDAAGKPVNCVYTNADGKYELYVPASLQGYVLVVAEVPFRQDFRTGYTIASRVADGRDRPIDEDTATVTKYLRDILKTKLANILDLLDEAPDSPNNPFKHPEALVTFLRGENVDHAPTAGETALEALVVPPITALLTAIKDNPNITRDDYEALAERLGDILIAHAGDDPSNSLSDLGFVDSTFDAFARFMGDNPRYKAYQANPNGTKVLATMTDILRAVRVRMTHIGTDPAEVAHVFADKPYIRYANAFYAARQAADPRRYPLPAPRYVIEKPSDLADFLVNEYFPLVAHAHYGTGASPSPVAAFGLLDAATPAAEVGCDLADGCLPPGGIADIDNTQIHALGTAVLRDLNRTAPLPGAADDPALDETDIHMLYAGAASLGIAVLQSIQANHCELVDAIHHYKGGQAPACAPSAE